MTGPEAAERERKEVAAGAGLASFGQLISGVFNLLLLMVLTRSLSKAEFGLFSLVYLIQDTASALLPLGLPAALAYFVPRRADTQGRALGFWTGMLLGLLAIPATLVLWFIGPVLSSNPETSEVFRLLAVFVLLDFPSQALPAYLLARRAYRGFFLITLLFSVTRTVSLALPAMLGATLPTIMGWFLVAAVFRLVMYLGYFLGYAEGHLDWKEVKPGELFGFGVPLSAATIVSKLNVQADKYMVSLVAGREALGTYTVGATELPLVPSLAYSVTNSLVPTLSLAHARGDRESFLRYWHDSMIKVAEIIMPVFFFFLLLAGPAIRVLFSASFEAAVVPFRVYLLLLPLRLCSYGAVLRSLGETRAVFTSAIAALAANLILILPLYYLLGLAGPAVAAVIGQLVIVSLLLVQIRAALGIHWSELLPYRPLKKTILTAGVSALPLLGLAVWQAPDGLRLLIGAATMIPLYLILGHRTGVIGPKDMEYLWRLFTLGGLRRRESEGTQSWDDS